MRASTIFALIVAVLLGLGVAVAVRASGLFDRTTEAKQPPPPPQILVAAINIFESRLLQASDVKLRPATPAERAEREKAEREGRPSPFLPPMVQAVIARQARVNIEADRPIRREDLEELSLPTSLNARLSKGTVAVNVAATRDHCAGGLIQTGDWVHVQLTTTVEASTGNGVAPVTRTAIIARTLPVVAKRNSLWPVSTPAGNNDPINFTLEANPYRAALIEFAKDKGAIALLPVSQAERSTLEARREELLRNPNSALPVSFAQDTPEYRDEDKRVQGILAGSYHVGEADLARIFDLRFTPPPPAPQPLQVQRVSGVSLAGQHTFPAAAPVSGPPGAAVQSAALNAGPSGAPAGVAGQIFSGSTAAGSPFRFRPPESACATKRKG
jgi:Flp pilus assembly protein CpaB